MKKAYSKPEIVFENFMSSTNIAACGIDTNLQTRNVCGIDFGGGTVLFTTGISHCTEEGANYDVCYDNPSDDNRLFGS